MGPWEEAVREPELVGKEHLTREPENSQDRSEQRGLGQEERVLGGPGLSACVHRGAYTSDLSQHPCGLPWTYMGHGWNRVNLIDSANVRLISGGV